MNIDWIDFLKSNNAAISDNLKIQFPTKQQAATNSITALAHLAIIKITGKDAAQFLQGQLTCNVNDLTDSNSFFAAFCNAKGRAISTLLILKNADEFLVVLPVELVEKVSNKLKMYILRADVQLHDVSNKFCLIGINTDNAELLASFPKDSFAMTNGSEITIKFPVNNRYLIISPVDHAPTLWTRLTTDHGLIACNSDSWLYQDISSGIPWLTQASSEQYIPQMLNIDKLGGISFKKGCYTGQEIIARTHFLGKAKRELFLAECNSDTILDEKTHIMTDESEKAIGHILAFQSNNQNHRILVVLPIADVNLKNLILNNSNQAKISIINFQ